MENKLVENEEKEDKEAAVAISDEDIAVDDVKNATVDELADAVQAGAEAASDGEETYSDEKAKKVAQELKTVAKGLDRLAWAPLDVRNEITDLLDDCLAEAFIAREAGIASNTDVLISGLPGSGKTGIVEQWAKDRGVNLLQLSANDREIEATLNGFPVPVDVDFEDGTKGKVASRAFSQALEPLEREKSVLFLDEFNRAPQSLRASLLKLINEHKVVGPGDDGMRRFKNLLFTIACINPSIPTDPGAIPLNDAERSRFLHQPPSWDSRKKEARNYLSFMLKKTITELDKSKPSYSMLFKKYSNAYNIAMALLKDSRFSFDTEKDLTDLYKKNCKLFNQRDLTKSLLSVASDKNRYLAWIDNSSNYLPKTKQMIHDILDNWIPPVVAVPDEDNTAADNAGAAQATDNTAVNTPGKKNLSGNFDDIFGGGGTESDTGLFAGGATGATAGAVTGQQAKQRLDTFDFSL
jgi:hypothetical protein